MSIPTNPVSAGSATKKSDYDALYNGSVLVNTGGTPGGAQSIPGVKTFSATTTFESGLIASAASTFHEGITASATSSVFALSNKINLRAGFIASGTCTYYAPVSGEESAGTPHPAPTSSNTSIRVFNTAPAITPSYSTLDFSSYVPAGTEAVFLTGYVKVGSNTITDLRICLPTLKTTYSSGYFGFQGYGGAAFQIFPVSFFLMLDSDRKGYIARGNASLISVSLFLSEYFI